jgi:hypothetical protein
MEGLKMNREQNIERILEAAVIVSWSDLIPERTGLVNIEYGFSPKGTLDHLLILASVRRGYWLLICSYSMPDSTVQDSGIHFENRFRSQTLAHILEVVMQHQSAFILPLKQNWQAVLRINTPTEVEDKAAAVAIKDALDLAGAGGNRFSPCRAA